MGINSKFPIFSVVFSIILLPIIHAATFNRNKDYVNTFEIDYENDQFLMNGEPFRYIAGSIHYFRVPEELWEDRLTKIRAAGFNAIQFVIPWNLHQRFPDSEPDFTGILDIERFIGIAKDLGLFVLLRPGPYICAERNGGGLPWWLYKLHPDIKLRTSDANYLKHVDEWWDILLPMMQKHLFSNGGNIIMVQMENEFGSYGSDAEYGIHLRDKAIEHLGNDTVLYTTDGADLKHLNKGKIPGVYATVDFGSGQDPSKKFGEQKKVEPHGPPVNSEYYPGWLDYWGEPHEIRNGDKIADSLDKYLSYQNASVTVFMAHGGTSFGLESGVNNNKKYPDSINAEPTSYDYDAPITEAGDLTQKYFKIKDVISKYLPLPNITVEETVPKGDYGSVEMISVASVFDLKGSSIFHKLNEADYPMTFEQLDQENGFILYEHTITQNFRDPSLLTVTENGVRDRAYIYINGQPQGILSRMDAIWSMPLSKVFPGDKLQILVENQGRIGYGTGNVDFKGLIGNVTLSGHVLQGWEMNGMPLNDTNALFKVVNEVSDRKMNAPNLAGRTKNELKITNTMGSFWKGQLAIECENGKMANDTFLQLEGWTKGIAFVNGFNLGRYWPVMGPQVTLYVPRTILSCNQINEIILFEQEQPGPGCLTMNHNYKIPTGENCTVQFVTNHVINGPVPLN